LIGENVNPQRGFKTALVSARLRWFNRHRELKAKTKKHTTKQFAASAAVLTKLVISIERQRLKHARTGRAESVLSRHTSAGQERE